MAAPWMRKAIGDRLSEAGPSRSPHNCNANVSSPTVTVSSVERLMMLYSLVSIILIAPLHVLVFTEIGWLCTSVETLLVPSESRLEQRLRRVRAQSARLLRRASSVRTVLAVRHCSVQRSALMCCARAAALPAEAVYSRTARCDAAAASCRSAPMRTAAADAPRARARSARRNSTAAFALAIAASNAAAFMPFTSASSQADVRAAKGSMRSSCGISTGTSGPSGTAPSRAAVISAAIMLAAWTSCAGDGYASVYGKSSHRWRVVSMFSLYCRRHQRVIIRICEAETIGIAWTRDMVASTLLRWLSELRKRRRRRRLGVRVGAWCAAGHNA
jgi:hypothetical protein